MILVAHLGIGLRVLIDDYINEKENNNEQQSPELTYCPREISTTTFSIRFYWTALLLCPTESFCTALQSRVKEVGNLKDQGFKKKSFLEEIWTFIKFQKAELLPGACTVRLHFCDSFNKFTTTIHYL